MASGATRVVYQAPNGIGGRYYGTRSRNLFWLMVLPFIILRERSIRYAKGGA